MKNRNWQAFSLLYRYPAFGCLWIGRLISLCGDAFSLIALPRFVLQITGSGTATAGILLTLQLPAILTSTIIGSLIDHFQPRTIMTIDNGVLAKNLIRVCLIGCQGFKLHAGNRDTTRSAVIAEYLIRVR